MQYMVERGHNGLYTYGLCEDGQFDKSVVHCTPYAYNDYGRLDVDAVCMIAMQVVGNVARHLVGLGRRDMYAIDNAIRCAYVRIYAGVDINRAVYDVDNHDAQDMIDTAINAVVIAADNASVDNTSGLIKAYYNTIVKPAYKAVNALVWSERKQAHVNLDTVVATYDIDTHDHIVESASRWLGRARRGLIDSDVAKRVQGLTAIQYDVLCDLVQGLSYRAIATRRGRKLATVQSHVAALRRIFEGV